MDVAVFSSTEQALSVLASLTGKKVMVAVDDDLAVDDMLQEWRDVRRLRPGKWNFNAIDDAVWTFGYSSMKDFINDNPEVIGNILEYIEEKIKKDSDWKKALKKQLSDEGTDE